MKKYLAPLTSSTLLVLLSALPGCSGPFMAVGAATGAGIYETRPDEGAPADPNAQIPPHESWCYTTLGKEVECYAEPQDTQPGRLVNVDPPSRYPLTHKAYLDAVDKTHPQPKPEPVAAEDIPVVKPADVTRKPLSLTPPAEKKPMAKAPAKAKKHKAKKKKTAPPKPSASTTTAPATNDTSAVPKADPKPAKTRPLPKAVPNPPEDEPDLR